MDVNERIAMLEEAREMILAAADLIEGAVARTDIAISCDAYIISHLRNWADEDGANPYDQTVDRIIEDLQRGE
jgi:hypothetical protein